jgi:hypothetical protein
MQIEQLGKFLVLFWTKKMGEILEKCGRKYHRRVKENRGSNKYEEISENSTASPDLTSSHFYIAITVSAAWEELKTSHFANIWRQYDLSKRLSWFLFGFLVKIFYVLSFQN